MALSAKQRAAADAESGVNAAQSTLDTASAKSLVSAAEQAKAQADAKLLKLKLHRRRRGDRFRP